MIGFESKSTPDLMTQPGSGDADQDAPVDRRASRRHRQCQHHHPAHLGTGRTELTITLYQEPTITFPEWRIGDWVTFGDDPFYSGKMYLQRRIIGYSVTVVPDLEATTATSRSPWS